MPAPAIAAAVIAAITSAATTASSEIVKEVQSDGTWISALFQNHTKSSFSVTHRTPNHGSWKKTAATKVIGLDEFIATLRSDGVKDDEVEKKLEEWRAQKIIESKLQGFFTGWGMQGEGVGVEGLTVFSTPAHDNLYIVCLVRKIPGGDYGAGVSISNGGWLNFEDDEGSNLIDHIQSVQSSLSQFSTGSTKTVSLGGISVAITAGQSVSFTVTEAGVG